MSMKKIVSAAMALVMTASLAVPAFATDSVVSSPDSSTGVYGAAADITGTTQAPNIKVTIPSTGAVVVNPYKMEVTSGSATVQDQIVSAAQFIKNESNVEVAIDVTTTGELGTNSEAVLATNTVASTVTSKSVFLYFEIMPSTDGSTAPTCASAYDTKNTAMVPVANAKATTKKDTVKLAAGDSSPTFAAFHLAGNAASNPTKPWSSDDTVNVKLAFTIRPVVATTT